ncbi:MAG: hypothetical protein HPY81_03025 [Firmicutes bacterium]|nr:hypothetical protein [Bacillota bacterium]
MYQDLKGEHDEQSIQEQVYDHAYEVIQHYKNLRLPEEIARSQGIPQRVTGGQASGTGSGTGRYR